MAYESSNGYLYVISNFVGTSEPALKLLFTIIAGKKFSYNL